jgi:hypothetical protein
MQSGSSPFAANLSFLLQTTEAKRSRRAKKWRQKKSPVLNEGFHVFFKLV